MIHDSYGVHANSVDRLSRILREQFVGIYQDNWLDRVQREADDLAGGAGFLPHYSDFITLGDFDVREVLNSEFFFA
jgi:DNA-directed RNA polymerase